MLFLVAGLVLFLGTHAFTMFRAPRQNMRGNWGEGTYKGIYTGVSIIGLGLIIYGFGQYRATGWINLWNPPIWTKHLALLLNLPIFVLLAASGAPGKIKAVTKHPMLLAVKIWATSHLLANGDLGSMLMFGSFLAWAVLARISIKRRPEEVLAAAARAQMQFGKNDIIALAAGITLYVASVLWLHTYLIGVAVLPGR